MSDRRFRHRKVPGRVRIIHVSCCRRWIASAGGERGHAAGSRSPAGRADRRHRPPTRPALDRDGARTAAPSRSSRIPVGDHDQSAGQWKRGHPSATSLSAPCRIRRPDSQHLAAGKVSAGIVGEDDSRSDPLAHRFAVDGEAPAHRHHDLQTVLTDPVRVRCQHRRQHRAAVPHTDRDGPPSTSSVSRQGPGAYLRALVTSSLTTSCTMPIARPETGSPCTACSLTRNDRARSRAWAISSLPSNAATTDAGLSTSDPLLSPSAASSIQPPHTDPRRLTAHTLSAPPPARPLSRQARWGISSGPGRDGWGTPGG